MIVVNQAFKSYGRTKVLNNLTFTVKDNQIVGLLGVNGVGKSTVLKAITGLIQLDKGEIRIDGKAPSSTTRGMIAYLPEVDSWYSWMRLSDAISFMKDVYWDWDDRKADHLLDFLELTKDMHIMKASKGTRAKMKLLLALSRQSKYLLLDEPFSGIDPIAREQISHAIIEDFLEEGQTIILTTHEVAEVEILLDEVVFMNEGSVLLEGNVETLKQEKEMSLTAIMKEVYKLARI